MKPKTNNKGGIIDRCQTPPEEALPSLLPWLDIIHQDYPIIWESASGKDQLSFGLAQALPHNQIIATDILDYHLGGTGDNRDFFSWQPDKWDIQVTNPPGSKKYKWLKRSYELNKPFALLVPDSTLSAIQFQRLAKFYGCVVILLDHRINYRMPYKGYDGHGSQFGSVWITWKLIPSKELCSFRFGEVKQVKR